MKLNWLFGALACLAAAPVLAQTAGRETTNSIIPRSAGPLAKDTLLDPPGVAKVKQTSLNIRSQPDFNGDVLGHVHRDQEVKILEQITLAKPKLNEPAEWSRIALPSDAAVWVFAEYVDTNAMTISRTRVNLRGGPGDNFTIVARIEKGATIKEVRRNKDWMQIEPPTNAYGYIATEYLTMEPAGAVIAAVPPVVAAPPVAVAPPVAEVAKPVAEVAKPTPAPPPPEPKPTAVVVATPEELKPAVDTSTNTTIAAAPPASNSLSGWRTAGPLGSAAAVPPGTNATPVTTNTTAIVAPEPDLAIPPPILASDMTNGAKAVVPVANNAVVVAKPRKSTREGIIRKTNNLQAPTDFELEEVDSHSIIEYIEPASADKNFKIYVGKRVLIYGPEWLDPRWPRRPILKVETVEIMP